MHLAFGGRRAYSSDMAMPLQKELSTFARELPNLLPTQRGKFVLIHGHRVDSTWSSLDEALEAGYDRFGLKAFLVQEITDQEESLFFSRNVTPCR
jgi:hypothetical protein